MKRARDDSDEEAEEEKAEKTPLFKEHALVLPKKALVKVDYSAARQSLVPLADLASPLFEAKNNLTSLALFGNLENRPLWVKPDGKIFLEAFSPLADKAIDFLTSISEPVSRPERIHEYKLTPYSLYAAVAVGLETQAIIHVLALLSKIQLPEEVIRFIEDCTASYGKVKLVLKHNRYFIESAHTEILKRLLNDPEISQAFLQQTSENQILATRRLLPTPNQSIAPSITSEFGAIITIDDEDDKDDLDAETILDQESDFIHSFEIKSQFAESVRKRCGDLDFPLMEEYDFRHDEVNPNLNIDLQPRTAIRDYQETCLSKMFGNGRARSGIIVLPTGAGKTLVGVTAACTVKKNTLVLCTGGISVDQWANEFRNWSTVKEGQIAKFTSTHKAKFAGDAGIVISTYAMITHDKGRAKEAEKMINFISSTEWGLLILDEVHVVPANTFRKVLMRIGAHCKLGLTATLVREDDKITDLNFLIGPKLYEANWMDLADRGHIAKVEINEIWCPMTSEFYTEYIKQGLTPAKKRLICVMNPTKLMACQYLIQWRESMGDKTIVFSDNVFALKYYAEKLNRPYLYGGTSMEERQQILSMFRTHSDARFRTLFLSKVGDTSLDLPEATCLIQISSQGASRRQEAQRLGRILRAKRRTEEGFKSRFYTLVSRDTDEMHFSAKRKRFLIDQGYAYNVIPNLEEMIPMAKQLLLRPQERLDLLDIVCKADDAAGKEEVVADDDDVNKGSGRKAGEKSSSGKKKKGAKDVPEKKGTALFAKWRSGK